MIIVNTSPNKLIQIGYEGEDKVTILRFSYSEKWLENGEGIFTVRVLRNGENQAYNAQMVDDDRENFTIDMTVTDVELSKKGYGEMQLVYTGADFVKKSQVYKYYVSRSVDEAVDPPDGDVYTQIIESLADLRVDFNELSDMVSEINDDIGDLTELTTANKLNIVESINEVNAKSFVSVDDELSDVSTNPVQNRAITEQIDFLTGDVQGLQTAVQGKADIQTVYALSDAVQDLDGDVQGLQTTVQAKADTTTVTALSGTVSGLQTTVQSKADTSTVTALSGTVSALSDAAQQYMEHTEAALDNKADVSAFNDLYGTVTGLQTSKADTTTVTALSGTVSGLQTTVQSKADTATVTALSGTVSNLSDSAQQYMEYTNASISQLRGNKADKFYVDSELALKADAQTVTALSGTVTGLQTNKADKSYVDTQLAGKASTATATASADGLMSAQDKSKLDVVYADYASALTALGGGS